MSTGISVCGRLKFYILGQSEFDNFNVYIVDELEAILKIGNLDTDTPSFV